MILKDKVVIVTGASRGLGKEIALLFAKNGAKVVVDYHVSDYEKDAFENACDVVKEIESLGGEAFKFECDVSCEEEVKNLISETVKRFSKIDILINNAGVVFDVPFFEKSVSEWRRTLDVNVVGAFLCSKYVGKVMLENKFGRIVNISSTNGIYCFSPESVDYDSSKAGLILLTKNLAKELAPNVLVNCVAPGWVDTPMNYDLPEDFVEEERKKIYLKRFADPLEIAEVVLFLVSSKARYVNGSIINVDGGYSN